ncbi:hypothetical protein S7335_3508 [Synechococcus sp. PCC 7335]|uniref:hypothetical protein n=1 Tax=Synechococcus sp. (strain ATCC 29403 / PCC 7335) TaxID=91464 RepID=UPI00017EB427|nr:hypothetical protein [Synechococcus sp. PCC 7335]EDX85805.1 hypothetical protein S7335_3508 [Synechococcus sp. PCC 7335]
MKLSPTDAQRFMSLMLPLQWYVNQTARILPEIKDFESFCATEAEEKIQVRDYLFAHTELIDRFVQDNLEGLDKEGLETILSWKNYVSGDFYIERFLKKYNIFIADDDTVYGVLGLTNSPSDFIDKSNLPIRVQTILLPFQNKIVYDGFLRFYNVLFGRGISSSLKQVYLITKDNNAIVQTFDSSATEPKAKKKSTGKKSTNTDKDWALLLEELSTKAKKLKGGGGQPMTYSPTFSLVRASLELAKLATESQPDTDKLIKKHNRISTLLDQVADAIIREQ